MQAVWSSTLESGNETIDEQHKELFTYMNDFFDTINKNRDYEVVVRTLNYLVKYVRFHFGTEEEMMRAADYHDFKDHLSAHRKIVEELMKCYKSLISQGSAQEITEDLAILLQEWFVNHIMGHDIRLAEYLRNNEAK